VLDPVMVATSGDRLIAEETVSVLVRELFPRVRVVTPNLDEAALLLGRPLSQVTQLQTAADDLQALGAQAVLLKGGHVQGNEVVDVLTQAGQASEVFTSARIHSHNVHGTGCSLSSAMAAHLALGYTLSQAVAHARQYILQAIATGAQVRTGQGHGPLNHGFQPLVMHVKPQPTPGG
jgi:hydroxymethylpyrimidine/phosphomethylpyrimidine kinase